MKKTLLGIVALLIMAFLYISQPPILSSAKAIMSATEQLQNSTAEWGNTFSEIDFNGLADESFSLSLNQQTGLWNQITNRKQWEVTLTYEAIRPTVVLDAYTGRLITIVGPMN